MGLEFARRASGKLRKPLWKATALRRWILPSSKYDVHFLLRNQYRRVVRRTDKGAACTEGLWQHTLILQCVALCVVVTGVYKLPDS
jgi:hypothetical protein